MNDKLKILGAALFFCLPGSLILFLLVGSVMYVYNNVLSKWSTK